MTEFQYEDLPFEYDDEVLDPTEEQIAAAEAMTDYGDDTNTEGDAPPLPPSSET